MHILDYPGRPLVQSYVSLYEEGRGTSDTNTLRRSHCEGGAEGWCHKPRNDGSNQKLDEARSRFSPLKPLECSSADILISSW